MEQLVFDSDLGAFTAAVTPWLEAHAAENSLLLGTLLTAKPERASGIFLRTPVDADSSFAALYLERNLIITRGAPAVLSGAAALLADLEVSLPGVVGPAAASTELALRYAQLRGCHAQLAMEDRLYELTAVEPFPRAPGVAQMLSVEHLEWVADWFRAFSAEAVPHDALDLDRARQMAARRLQGGSVWAWWLEGEPVAMASLSRPTRTTVSVSGVFVPPAQRGRGFGAAVVAAVSEEGLRSGKRSCVLYADAQNPTSNHVYRKVGYRHVGDSRNYVIRAS